MQSEAAGLPVQGAQRSSPEGPSLCKFKKPPEPHRYHFIRFLAAVCASVACRRSPAAGARRDWMEMVQ